MSWSDDETPIRKYPQLHSDPTFKKHCCNCKFRASYIFGVCDDGAFGICDKFPDAKVPLSGYYCNEHEPEVVR